MNEQKTNPLGTEKISSLLLRFGNSKHYRYECKCYIIWQTSFLLAEALECLEMPQTNVAFPLVITCTSIALMCGIGGANFNLCMDDAKRMKQLLRWKCDHHAIFTWCDSLHRQDYF